MSNIFKVYDVPATYENGRYGIDASIINLIADMSSFGFNVKEETERIFDVPATIEEDGRYGIDVSIFNIILDGINQRRELNNQNVVQTPKEEVKVDVNTERIKIFKAKIQRLFIDCVLKTPVDIDDSHSVIGEAPGIKFRFDIDKIALFSSEIQDLLDQLTEIVRFQDMKIFKDGVQWTVMNQDIRILLCLATAAGIIDYKMTDDNSMDKNPILKLKR